MATWKVIDYGAVPEDAPTIEYTCPGCGRDAELPVVGTALAQLPMGIVFDTGTHAMPTRIRCRHCRRTYELEPERVTR